MDPHSELEKHITAAGSLRKLAKQWKVSAAYISEYRKKSRRISDTLLSRMGMERKTTYRSVANAP